MSPQASDCELFHGNPANKPDPIPIALATGLICEKDADLIKAYVYEHSTSANISKIVVLQLTRQLINLRKWSGPFAEASIIDLYKIVEGVKTDLSKFGRPYAEQTQRDYIKRAKSFFLWLNDNGQIRIPEKKIRAVKPPNPVAGIKNISSLLTSDEILELLKYCSNSRNRAIFSVLYEGGFRIGEVGTMKWGALKFDSGGVVVNVLYKTKKPRYIRLVMCVDALAKWKSDYPGEITDDSYVFVNNRGKILQYSAIKRILERTLKQTEIKKKVTPHLFRHSRITHLIQQGVSESVIKLMMWGSVDAKSFSTYAHLTGSDVDREIYKLYGIEAKIEKKREKSIEPKICPHCKEICGPLSRYCSVCGQLLDEQDIQTDEQLQKWLLDNSTYLTAYLNKLQLQREIVKTS